MNFRVGTKAMGNIKGGRFKKAGYIFRGALIGLVFSTIGVLLAAAVAKSTGLADNVILIINVVVKILSIFLATWFAVGAIGEKGWLYGALTGLVYMIVGGLLFSIIDGSVSPIGTFVWDLLLGAVAGAVSGMITVSIKK